MGSVRRDKQPQDTTLIKPLTDTIPKIINQDSITVFFQDTTVSPDTSFASEMKQYSIQEVLQIFEREQEHLEKVDSIYEITRKKSEKKVAPPVKTEPDFQLDSSSIIISIGENQGLKPLFFKNMWGQNYKKISQKEYLFIPIKKTNANLPIKTRTEVPVTSPGNYRSQDEIPSFWNDWILGIIIVSFIFFGWIRLFYNKVLSATLNSLFNYKMSYNIFQDKSSLTQRAFMIMDLIFYLNTGLFIYLSAKHFNSTLIKTAGFKSFLIFTGFVIAIHLARFITSKIAGYISLSQQLFSEYLHNVFIYARVSGFILLPFLITIPYIDYRITPIVIFAGAVIFVLLYILRIIRGIKIFALRKVSVLYLFLYLCTLEFIPVLVFFKYIGVF